jgi:hypothetical protein
MDLASIVADFGRRKVFEPDRCRRHLLRIGRSCAARQYDFLVSESDLELVAGQHLTIGRLARRRFGFGCLEAGIASLLAQLLDGSRPRRALDHIVGHTLCGRDAGFNDLVVCLEAVLEVRNVVASLAEIGCVRHRKFRPSLEIFNLAEANLKQLTKPNLVQPLNVSTVTSFAISPLSGALLLSTCVRWERFCLTRLSFFERICRPREYVFELVP